MVPGAIAKALGIGPKSVVKYAFQVGRATVPPTSGTDVAFGSEPSRRRGMLAQKITPGRDFVGT
jgi:hypothetical protein